MSRYIIKGEVHFYIAILPSGCISKSVPHHVVRQSGWEKHLDLSQCSQDVVAVFGLFGCLAVKEKEFVQTAYSGTISIFPGISEIHGKQTHGKRCPGVVLHSIQVRTLRPCRGRLCLFLWCFLRVFVFEAYFRLHILQMKPGKSQPSSLLQGIAISSTNLCITVVA